MFFNCFTERKGPMASTREARLNKLPVSRQQVRQKREGLINCVLSILNLPPVDSWPQRDQQLAETLQLGTRHLTRVRLGEKNLGDEKLEELRKALAAHSEFINIDDLGRGVWGSRGSNEGSERHEFAKTQKS
jgi:hypothetical protein